MLDPDPVCVWELVSVEDRDSVSELVLLGLSEGEPVLDPDPVCV